MEYEIRTVVDEKTGETLYCAYDIATCVGYKSATSAASRYCKGTRMLTVGSSSNWGERYMKFLNKDEVYTFLSKATLKKSKEFKLWFDKNLNLENKSEKEFNKAEKEVLYKILAVLVRTIEEIKEIEKGV